MMQILIDADACPVKDETYTPLKGCVRFVRVRRVSEALSASVRAIT